MRIAMHTWKENLESCTGKLRTYSKFKKDLVLENYVLQFPLHIRRNLSKLRISAHNLAIETGRYIKDKSPSARDINKRLCFHCKSKSVESELYLIFECHLYNSERKELISKLSKFTSITFNATEDIFCKLMSCLNGDLEVGKAFCDFLNKCFKLRNETLSEIKENNILCRPETTVTRIGRVSKRPQRMDL